MNAIMKHAIWLGQVITILGFITYFTLFAKFPALRDFPWINLPIVLGGLALTAIGVREIWAGASLGKQVLASVGLGMTALVALLFCGYVFWLSYQLPEPGAETMAAKQAPPFELSDANGNTVRLADFRGKRLIISFYRGPW